MEWFLAKFMHERLAFWDLHKKGEDEMSQGTLPFPLWPVLEGCWQVDSVMHPNIGLSLNPWHFLYYKFSFNPAIQPSAEHLPRQQVMTPKHHKNLIQEFEDAILSAEWTRFWQSGDWNLHISVRMLAHSTDILWGIDAKREGSKMTYALTLSTA